MDKCQELFAATPPLEALKILLSLAVTEGVGHKKGVQCKLDFIDISRAYFHAKARRSIYSKLPPGDNQPGMVGRLNKAMYGTRDAAQNWECEYREFMVKTGFTACRSSPCIYWHKQRDIRGVIHGDGFTILGSEDNLLWFRQESAKRFKAKFRGMLGPGD